MDPYLADALQTALPTDSFLVVLTFWHPEDRSRLDGFVTHYKFRALSMAAATLTPSQILALTAWTEIRSIWYGLEQLPILLAEGRQLVEAQQATDQFGVTGRGVKVAVIDTGVDTLHPDFGGRATNFEVAFAGACTFARHPNSDDEGHGTHVSGTIAGSGALSGGHFKGIAPEAEIVMYDTNAGLFIILVEALCSYDDIIARGDIKVVSNSWGGGSGSYDRDDPVEVAVQEAYAHGVVSVFAAGNSGPDANTMTQESVSPFVVGVGAITKKKQIVGFSSRGRPLDFAERSPWPNNHDRDKGLAQNVPLWRPAVSAPGVSITAPVPCSPACTAEIGYDTLSGTSMATPHVSGVLALVLQANPNLTPRQRIGILEATPTIIRDWLAFETGVGLVNTRRAVELAANIAANPSTAIPKPVLDESLDGARTTRTGQGPVLIVGSASSPDPSTCLTPTTCRDFFIKVPTGATRLFVKVTWNDFSHNFYPFAFAPGQSTSDFPTQEDTGLLDAPITERLIDIRYPVAGEWRIRVLPRVNTVDSVSLTIFTSVA